MSTAELRVCCGRHNGTMPCAQHPAGCCENCPDHPEHRQSTTAAVRRGPTDEYGMCAVCGGGGSVTRGDRTNAHGRVVPNLVACPHCDGRDRITPMMEARVDG